MTQTVSTAASMITDEREVNRWVADIQAKVDARDFDGARMLERALWEGVLEAVASGNAQAGYLAAAALESKSIRFARI